MLFRQTSCTILLFVFLTQQLLAQEINQSIKSPSTYFQQRLEAIKLCKNGQWEESKVVLKDLLVQYQNDPELYYLIGISLYETGNYQESIDYFSYCLDLGGASLLGNQINSDPFNDIMVKIAQAYGKLGDKDNTIVWLKKAFEARYDEKPFLIGSPEFEVFSGDREFLELFGVSSRENMTRTEAWETDLSYLESRIGQMNYTLNKGDDRTKIIESFTQVKASISSLSDEEIIVEIMKIVGKLGSGHNLIIPTTPTTGALKKLPIQLYYFSDGMFIVDANDDYKEWIGYEVESIGDMAIEEVLLKSNEVNSRDNDMQILWLGPYYITLPDVLKGLGVIDKTDKVILSLKDSIENTVDLEIAPEDWNFTGFPKLPKLREGQQPLFLSRMDEVYWSTLLIENKAMYVQFNAVAEKEEQSLELFCEEWYTLSQENKVKNLILDLRHNQGGNGSLLPSIHQAVRKFVTMTPDGRVFVLTGRGTFSAAQNLLTKLTEYANPIVVGEPSGSRPNHIGEAGWVRLPNSGLMAIISTQFHQTSRAEDQRKWIAPHMPVSLSSGDYFSGNDPILEEIKKLIQVLDEK
ncbi:MAG: hypothetical protein P1U70_27985 [Saprospiraceae bacterium]|nr:hypothetical protein [Saprospiraceae bacterium]